MYIIIVITTVLYCFISPFYLIGPMDYRYETKIDRLMESFGAQSDSEEYNYFYLFFSTEKELHKVEIVLRKKRSYDEFIHMKRLNNQTYH